MSARRPKSIRGLARARRAREIAPVLAVAALLVLPSLGDFEMADERLVHERVLHVVDAIAHVPYTIGDWRGRDVEVPRTAVELLRTPAILGRRYEKAGAIESAVGVYVVHCPDARDMGAHYPPVCYPSQGWSRAWDSDAGAPTCTLRFAGRTVEASIYEFRREESGAPVRYRTVVNFFVRPNGASSATLPRYNRLLERYEHGARGVSQVHVDFVYGDRWTRSAMVTVANELLGGLGPLPLALGVTPADGPAGNASTIDRPEGLVRNTLGEKDS